MEQGGPKQLWIIENTNDGGYIIIKDANGDLEMLIMELENTQVFVVILGTVVIQFNKLQMKDMLLWSHIPKI